MSNQVIKVNHALIAQDIQLIHNCAKGMEGNLILASFGQNPSSGENLRPRAESFTIGDIDRMVSRAQSLAGEEHRNIYVALCIMRADLEAGKKGSEGDIISVFGITADFDAKDDPSAHLWADRLPVSPTMVLETSSYPERSYQCRILFNKPITPDRAKRMAKSLQFHSGCDTCTQDLSHVWRIAGGLNYPNKVKVEKHGRPVEPQMVKIIVPYTEAKLIDPDELEKILGIDPEDNTNDEYKEATSNVEMEKTLPSIVSVDELDRWEVSKTLKTIIVKGIDAENPKTQDNSRSAWLFHAVCGLVRCGVPDEFILATILHPKFCISESVIEKGKNAKSYAVRQIERAKEENSNPLLEKMNLNHAIIENYGSKTVVVSFDKGGTFFHRTFEDFKKSNDNKKIQITDSGGKPKIIGQGTWFLEHPHRRQYQTVEFLPGKETPEGVLNLYRGPSIQAIAGDCSKFLKLIREVICSGDKDISDWLLDFIAHLFQKPWEPPEVCIVLRGRQGVGKNFFIERLGEIISDYFIVITNPKHLVGSFNRHLMDKLLVLADEAFYGRDRSHAGILKNLITQSQMAVEPKGVDVFMARKFFRLILASNEDFVAPADIDDRRNLVIDVSTERAKDHDYFHDLSEEWKNGGREAFYYQMLNRNIEKFNHRQRPETEALFEQKLHSLMGAERIIYEILYSGQAYLRSNNQDRYFVSTEDLRKFHTKRQEHTTNRALANELVLFALTPNSSRKTVDGTQIRGFWIPELDECRNLWAAAKRMKINWPEDDGKWANIHTKVPF